MRSRFTCHTIACHRRIYLPVDMKTGMAAAQRVAAIFIIIFIANLVAKSVAYSVAYLLRNRLHLQLRIRRSQFAHQLRGPVIFLDILRQC